jgi:hypothetical protein
MSRIQMSKPSTVGKIGKDSSLGNSIVLLNQYIPEVAWLVSLIKAGDGFLALPTAHANLLYADGVEPWARFYESADSIKSVSLNLLSGDQRVVDLIEKIQYSSSQKLLTLLKDLENQLLNEDLDDVAKTLGPSRDKIEQLWESVSSGDFSPEVMNTYKSYLLAMNIFLVVGHNCLSLMQFGVSIFNLVKQAKDGNDKSFLRAVTIDKSLLTSLDYFQSRLKRSHLTGDIHFLDGLSKALRAPMIGEKIQLSNLMIAFAILDDLGSLDIPLKQLMYVCEQIGVYGHDSEAHSEESLRQCRKRYRDKAVAKSRI